MNNIVNMVSYYISHKNADESIINYLKDKINKSTLEELIIIQIELLYTDPSDKLVTDLVGHITNKINDFLENINLYDLINVIIILNDKSNDLNKIILEKVNDNKNIFESIENKSFIKLENESNNEGASRLINTAQDNNFIINKNRSEINSINIWLNNLENSFDKRCNKSSINDLLNSYINLVNNSLKNEITDNYINKFLNIIEMRLLNNNIFDSISEILPELYIIYKNNYKEKNNLYKLVDYYMNLIDKKIIQNINQLSNLEKDKLKEKLDVIYNEFISDDIIDNDYKGKIINKYIHYL